MVLAMIVLSAIGIGAGGDAGHGGGSILGVLLSGVALVVAVILFVRYAANPLTERLARAPELLVIFAIALAAMFAAVGDLVGLGKEVADRLKVAEATVRHWIKAGELRAIDIGKGWRIADADLEQFIKRHETAPRLQNDGHEDPVRERR